MDSSVIATVFPPLDGRALRMALGQFATGVAIVTAFDVDHQPVGLTISSFNSVSLDPPLILFSVHRNASRLSALTECRGFAVNVLSREQSELSNRFARATESRWDDLEYHGGYVGAPCLDGVLTRFECVPYAQHDGGDHLIFVGRVVAMADPVMNPPLVFFRGKYHEIVQAA